MKESILRFMGIWSFEASKHLLGGWSARAKWGEACGRRGLSLGLVLNDRRLLLNICLGWPTLYIRLKFLERWAGESRDCLGDRWGFHLVDGNSIHLNWGEKIKIVHLPWAWDFYRHSFLLENGKWAHDIRRKGKHMPWHERSALALWVCEYPYTYVLRSGEVQQRVATITVDESECRRRWLIWTPLLARIQRSINVKFDAEVGEGTGSWKGGTYGCGYDLLPGEEPEACLRRMERERTFNR